MSIDEAEWAKLQEIVERFKPVSFGGRDAAAGIIPADFERVKQRIETIERAGGVPGVESDRERKSRAFSADVAAIVAEDLRLSAKAQSQFDGFLESGFRSKKDLETLSLFLTENSEDLNFGQRVQIVDEVLDGVERRDYEVDEIPGNVIAEVQKVLSDPEIKASVTANLTAEKTAVLNDALDSDDLKKLRTALEDQDIFAACHEHVSEARERFEAQKDGEKVVDEEVVKDPETKNDAVEASIDFLDSVDPTALPSQDSSQREL